MAQRLEVRKTYKLYVGGAFPRSESGRSYEVVDTKLARTPKAKFAVQLAFHSDLLRDAQGTMPEAMHVKLGDGREVSLRVADYDRYVADARDRLLAFTRTRPATVAEMEAEAAPAAC